MIQSLHMNIIVNIIRETIGVLNKIRSPCPYSFRIVQHWTSCMFLMIANAIGVLTVIFNNFTDIEKNTNIHTWIYNELSHGDTTFVSFSMLSCVLTVGVPCCDVRWRHNLCQLFYAIMCFNGRGSVLWCSLWFPHKSDVRLVFTSSCL